MRMYKVAVLGCTGLVGQHFIRMLDNHPFLEVNAIFASESSAGRKYGDVVKWWAGSELPETVRNMTIKKVDTASLPDDDIDIVFSALPAVAAGEIESVLRKRGYFVFSNTRSHRMDNDVPILIPEVNAGHLELAGQQKSKTGGFIITNSNCSTSGLAMALNPISKYGIQSVFVSTYQAISGAGMNGLPALGMEGNIIPFIDGEEEKMEVELRKILSVYEDQKFCEPEIPVTVNCCRVPVREGHLEAVVVRLRDNIDVPELKSNWSEFRAIPQHLKLPSAPEKPLLVREESDRPQPILDCYAGSPLRAAGMAVTIGRIRKKGNTVLFLLLVNNMVRGAAGTSILNAELAVHEGLLPNRDPGSEKPLMGDIQ